MQSDNRYMDRLDNFSRKVGEKVRNHSQSVDTSVWEDIEKRLSVKKRSLVPWRWIAASVAAVAIGLLFLLTPFNKEPAEQMSAENTQDEQIEIPEPQREKTKTFITEETRQPLMASKIRGRDELLVSHRIEEKLTDEPTTVERDDTVTSEAFIEKPMEKEAEKPEKTGKAEKTGSTDSTTIKKQHEDILLTKTSETPAERPGLRKRSKPSLLLAISGTSVDANLDFVDRAPLYADFYIGSNESAKDITNVHYQYATLTPSDYSEVSHLPPLSFSITGNFPLNKTWSVETGLMYTYMVSLFSKPGNIEYSGKLMLHYFGVPVSVKATFYQSNRWSIYLSGGGSIEKGLFSNYRQQIRYTDGTIKHTNVRSSIEGVQLSAHAATGLGYNINNRIQLFGEPRIVYYFNNNQPMSARTENPFTVGLNGGVKINF